ncbi:MAG: hypothetical protein KC486_08535 [Myxococcales bacterium]|nr:hypothetical protein [Myxococcales bacterium]
MVNDYGYEAEVDIAVDGHDLPFLQEPDDGLGDAWAVTYRDVVILDADNHEAGVYNLTDNDLADPINRYALKAMLLDAAE